MKLYYAPYSSYSQKTVMAFHEKDVAFTPEIVNLRDADSRAAYEKINLLGKVPTLVLDDGWRIPESSIIIEYLDTHFATGTRLIPEDKDLARRTRFIDRQSDLYVNDPAVAILLDKRKPETEKEPHRITRCHATIDKMFTIIEREMAEKQWALGDTFSMADCAAVAALTVCKLVHPFDQHKNIVSYYQRVSERPSYKKVFAEAAPYYAQMAAR